MLNIKRLAEILKNWIKLYMQDEIKSHHHRTSSKSLFQKDIIESQCWFCCSEEII